MDQQFVVVCNEHTIFGPFSEDEAAQFGRIMLLGGQSVRIAGLITPPEE